jgi:hypothetical protein
VPIETAKGELAGVTTENELPAAVMVSDLVAEAVTVPAASSHSTRTSTVPAAVPVRFILAVPVELVVPVAALKVPLPELVAAIE